MKNIGCVLLPGTYLKVPLGKRYGYAVCYCQPHCEEDICCVLLPASMCSRDRPVNRRVSVVCQMLRRLKGSGTL